MARRGLLTSFIALLIGCSHSRDPSVAFSEIRAAGQRGDFSLARREAQRCYKAWERKSNELWHWKFKLLDAEMLLVNAETRRAESLLRSAPPVKFSKLQPRYEMLLGYVAFRWRKNLQARLLLEHAASSAHAMGDFETEADSNLVQATFASTEEAQRIEKLIDQTLEVTRSRNLSYQSAAALVDLAVLRMRESRYASAITALEEAAGEAKRANAKLVYGQIIVNLAYCYSELGDFEKSTALQQQQAVSAIQQAGLTTPLRDSYLALGSAQLEQDKTADAVRSIRKALALTNERDAPGVYSVIAENLATALETEGRLDEAQRLNDQARAFLQPGDTEGRLWLLLNQAAIDEQRHKEEAALQLYANVTVSARDYPAAMWSAHAAIAQILAARPDVVSIRETRAHFEAALQTIESSRADQLESQYQITYLSRLIRFYQQYVRFLVRQGDSSGALIVADSSRASVLGSAITGVNARQDPDLIHKAQAGARRSNCAILFYFIAPGESYLWTISSRGVQCMALPGEQEITASVRSYEHVLEIEKADALQTAAKLPARLFQTLVAPALPALAGNRSFIVVPDGPLHRLNFETLVVDGPKPHYWIDDVTVAVAPSLNLLVSSRRQKPNAHSSLLLIGDPLSPGPDYPTLPFVNSEIEQVRRHFPPTSTTVLQQARAVPSAFLAAHPERFAVVHIAAHAEANERSPLDSAIILSPEHDGYRLYAREIMTTPLNAGLVVLSACRSAGSRTFSGEGPVGLVWAFFDAGAQNVAAGLWDVNDQSTARLMDRFYDARDKGDTYEGALRAAKLQTSKDTPRPYFWAPFQLYVRSFPAR